MVVVTKLGSWQNDQKPLTVLGDPAQAGQSSWFYRLIVLWLMGVMVLLPIDLIKLPLNMSLVDCWIFMGLPIFWLTFWRGHYVISWSYALPMWLIFVASFASTFATPAPMNSLIVILKELYVYVWFVTLAALLASLNNRDLRRVVAVWAGMVLLHGFVIIGQFLSPAIWQFTVSFAGSIKDFEIYRPAGLFLNANSAALFQLLGFVPLVLASPSLKVGMSLTLFLLVTMLLTGSMGAALAFGTGCMIAMVVIALSGRFIFIIKVLGRLAIVLSLLGGVLFFIISQNQRYQEHFARIFFGRAERSSEGRFDLWQRGIDAYIDNDVFLWGVGPENFREMDAKMTDNQLHNDFLAFSVERGLLGTLGLGLLAVLSLNRAFCMVLIHHKHPERGRIVVVVFLAAIIATMVESLTHQVFHFRELWLVLALQEAMLFKMTMSESGVEPTIHQPDVPPYLRRGLVVQPHVTGR